MSVIKYGSYKIHIKEICQNQRIDDLIKLIHGIVYVKNKNKRIVFTGEGNSGKTTVSSLLKKNYNNYAIIEIDNFIISRKLRKKKKLSGYNPKAFYLNNFIRVRTKVSQGRNQYIWTPYYDHQTGVVCKKNNCYNKLHNHKVNIKHVDTLIEVGTFLWKRQLSNNKKNNFFFYNLDDTYMERFNRDTKERAYSIEYAKEHLNQLIKDKKYISESLKYCQYLVVKKQNLFSLYLIKKVNKWKK